MGALRDPKQTTWSDLPEHLMERILESLPVDCFFRFRTVCRGWNSLFSSQHFNSIARNSQPFLILCPSNTQLPSLLYSFFTHTWRTIPLSFTPNDCPINFRGSSSGLLLADISTNFSWFDYTSPQLCVCNPLTQVFSTLPEMASVNNFMAKAILPAGNKKDEYTVMVVGRNSSNKVIIEAYNSTTKAWKVVGIIPDVVIRNENMFFFEGYLLGMTSNSGMMAYNIEQGISTIVAMPMAEGTHNLWVRLVCCKSGVFVIRAIEENHMLKRVVLWGLDSQKIAKEDYKWEEIGEMPSCVCEELRRSSNSNWLECVGVGDVICFRANESMEIAVYDVRERSWNWLPMFPAEMRYVNMRSFPLEVSPTIKFCSNSEESKLAGAQ